MAIKNKQFGDVRRNGPVGPWTDRVRYSSKGYAFRPDELLCSTSEDGENGRNKEETFDLLRRLVPDVRLPDEPLFDNEYLVVADQPIDVEAVTDEMRRRGFAVDPNYVLFGHSCCCGGGGYSPIGASPFYANPFYANAVTASGMGANPFYANAVSANPFYANPFYANPFYANPFYANDYQTSGERPSSARPATRPEALALASRVADHLPEDRAKVFILDTGLADDPPSFLDRPNYVGTPTADRDAPDESGDGFLDPASGHGTFIAGIIEQIAPNQQVHVCRVLSTFGEGDVADIATRLDQLRTQPKDGQKVDDKTIINLSFGGYADVDMPVLRKAIAALQERGAVVVASAGNDGRCQLMYPAAFPGVIGVGSLEPHGRAFYSNHGPWVRACAPGSHLTSAFHEYNGNRPAENGVDPDAFDEWAHWTGTSFAAPVVAGALARHIALTGQTAADAVAAVIDSPGLFRYPGLGTVVNLAPGM